MPRLPKQNWSVTEKRAAVDEVMSHWNYQGTYPTFGTFFDALLKANDNASTREIALKLTEATPRNYGHAAIQTLRDGTSQPTYQLISDLLDTNILNFDSARIRPATDSRPAGDQRVALFTKADLIEVTPHSIQQFNRDVMAGVQRHLDAGRTLHWSDIMRKLIEFHTQGERDSVVQIQRRLNSEAGDEPLFPTKDSLPNILGKNAKSNDQQRKALYEEVGLRPELVKVIEDALRSRQITDEMLPGTQTPFSQKLDGILKALVGTASLQDLQRASIDDVTGAPRILGTQLSLLRQGKGVAPTLTKMRAIVDVLDPLEGEFKKIKPGEVDELIALAGYTREQLNMTARDVIRKADESAPDIHALLSDLRYARDVNVTLDDVASPARMTTHGVELTADKVSSWETSVKTCPTREQVQELLERYSAIMVERQARLVQVGNPERQLTADEIAAAALTQEEIEKAARISDKTREDWEQSHRHEKKSRLKDNINWRKRLTPDISTNGRDLTR